MAADYRIRKTICKGFIYGLDSHYTIKPYALSGILQVPPPRHAKITEAIPQEMNNKTWIRPRMFSAGSSSAASAEQLHKYYRWVFLAMLTLNCEKTSH
jgi:hypothetical protein